MSACPVRFAGHIFAARSSGALWWPAERALIVADLHLGKSERMARRGGALLPPFETRDTLSRLMAEARATDPARLLLLGDTFDDTAAAAALPPQDRALWDTLRRTWHCAEIAGNHDPTGAPELSLAGIALRHIAEAGQGPDISGHYHPKLRLAGVARRAFVVGQAHLILPAFGAYTGGLWADDPAIAALVPRGIAVLTGPRAVPVPIGAGRRAPLRGAGG